jgi:chromosome partitioning protein
LADWVTGIAKYPVTVRADPSEINILQHLTELTEDHDLVVVDTVGASAQVTLFAMGAADLVLVPLQLSSGDFIEAVKTVELVKRTAKLARREIPLRVVVSGYKPNTGIAEHIDSELAAAKLPLLKARLHNLVAFQEMSFNGVVPLTGIAGLQAGALFDEALALSGGSVPEPAQKRAS